MIIKKKHLIIILGAGFAVAAIIARLVPHPWNFTPLSALALFAGFFLPKRWLWLPLAVRGLTDAIIGTFDYRIMIVVYLSYALMIGTTYLLRRHYGLRSIIMSSLGASLLFFFATNGAVWLWSDMYAPELSGLLASYYAGIPFFRYTLAGDLFYSAVFFGIYEAMMYAIFTLKLQARKKSSAIKN